MTPELGGIPEKEVIKQHWQAWNDLVEDKGWEDEDADTKEYDFVVDKRANELSLFTADDIVVTKLKIPLEEYIGTPLEFHSQPGEVYITIQVAPKNPYKPQFGIYSLEDTDFYYSESLAIYISNQGRAFELTTWGMILKPDAHKIQSPRFSYLKRYPEPEEIQARFTDEPQPFMENTEPFQSLKGQNLERLDSLLMKVKTGAIIEP